MTPTVIFVVVLVLIVVGVVLIALRSRRRAELQNRFGPEYERKVAQSGTRSEAEHHLRDVARERDKLPIRDLDPAERDRYVEHWQLLQARFVDEPARAVDGADQLLDEVLRSRGYPTDHEFESQADLIAADHPDVVQHYRAAHEAHERHRATGEADTEDLRQAFVHYRALFDSLVGTGDRTAPVTPEDETPAGEHRADERADGRRVADEHRVDLTDRRDETAYHEEPR
jgi:hypothetical protein